MRLAPHQRELLDRYPETDWRDIPEDWNGAADLDEKLHLNKQKRLAQKAAAKPAQAAAAPAPKKAKQFVTLRRHQADMKMIADLVGTAIAEYVAQLEKRIGELEGEKMKFVGVWKRGQAYSKGSFATHQGSGWHCNADTTAEPGTSPDWTLGIKRGRDGKDGKLREEDPCNGLMTSCAWLSTSSTARAKQPRQKSRGTWQTKAQHLTTLRTALKASMSFSTKVCGVG